MKTLKFEVKNEQHSKEIQDAIFALGGGWDHGNIISREYENTDKPELYIESRFYEDDDDKYLSLMWGDPNLPKINIADHVSAHVARSMTSDLSVHTEVTLENFQSYFNKIDYKRYHEKHIASD